MPYIKQSRRNPIDAKYIEQAVAVGDLNYTITQFLHQYIQQTGLNYNIINEVIGVLECCKLELYRMVAAPYENEKRIENGPISELEKQ